MNEHDRNLIAAYAEGSLHDDEEERAAALVASDAAAREEYEAQRAALTALAAAPAATMTGAERTRLRAAVGESLGFGAEEPARAATPAPTRRFRLVWGGLAAAAVLVVLVIGAAPFLDTLSVGGGDETEVTLELSDAPAASTTTSAAGESVAGTARSATDDAGSPAPPSADGFEESGPTTAAAATTTTAAAAESTQGDSRLSGYVFADPAPLPDLGAGTHEEILARARDALARRDGASVPVIPADESLGDCGPAIASAVPGATSATQVATAVVDGIAADLLLVTAPDGDVVVGISPDGCVLVLGPAAR